MSEERNKHIDKLIKKAADSYLPTPDEQSWDKMTQLLDKEFGEKKKRRFIVWWWLLPAIIVGGSITYLFITKTYQSPSKTYSAPKPNNIEISTDPGKLNDTLTVNKKRNGYFTESTLPEKEIHQYIQPYQNGRSVIRTNNVNNQQSTAIKVTNNSNPATDTITVSQPGFPEKSNGQNNIVADIRQLPPAKNTDNNTNTGKPGGIKTQQEGQTINYKKDSASVKESGQETSKKKTKKQVNKLYITGSTAIDASFVRISSIEKATLSYGIGIGYRLNKRFSLQTGFYAGKKIYNAQKQDYDFSKKPNFNYSNNVLNINADCYVYDIPLTVKYNFINRKKSNWFTTLGLSSYIMKSESYDILFNYLPVSPATHTTNWYYENQNNHFFSILNISAGYEIQVNKNIFLSAEPYYKIPLGGIGAGAIRLSSFGLQLNMGYNFLRKKNK